MIRRARSTRAASVLLGVLLAAAVNLAVGCGRASDARDDRALAAFPAPVVETGRAEILWDTWGVPHVYARDAEAAFEAFGRAQATAHADLLLGLVQVARGRAAEAWGRRYAESDRWVRTLGIPDRAERWYAAQSPTARGFLDAFARGVNDWVAENPGAVADSLRGVPPVTGADLLAHLQRIVHFGFVRGGWDAAARVGPAPAAGSNAWAIAPSRSASGHALLLANPHLPWRGAFTLFEAQIAAPGVDVYGATLVGFPFLAIAFNERLGWTHTVGPLDGADVYALELVADGYRWDGGTRAFETRVDTLRVRGPDGTVRAEPFTVRSSIHGPVVAESGGRAVALRVVGLDEPAALEQYWEMARAVDRAAFERALARLQMPFFNVVYADREGHVLYVFNGRLPERPEGDWTRWTGLLDGADPATLWSETHAYDELPRLADPPTGWLQNANDPPWTSTIPQVLDPAAFPPYAAPSVMGFRAQRSAALLAADSAIGFEEMIAAKHSTRMALADRWLDDLLPLVGPTADPRAVRAAEVLAAWDRSADADSRGAILFAEFVSEMALRRGGLGRSFTRGWDPARPLATPDGLADAAMAVDALTEAAFNVERRHGALDVAWGDVHRLRRDALDLPANGGPGDLGTFRVTEFDRRPDGTAVADFGDAFVMAVEFGDSVRARGLLVYGNASRPGSPHRVNQLPLYAEKRLRPIWHDRAAVEAHLERREALGETAGPP